ncbi:hypothetical protein CRE_31263 [Caenorhabditis remanei]|uniref:Uncharacterized protein n=1 Tax=Caenorhabditis remanei TaxID=31234 RepID=E3MLH9_CAERE|nr:hypothetical protein CRE_31263 [Caenorhabditis remanei]
MKLGCLLLLFLVILVAAIEARPADIAVFDIEPESTPYEEEPLLTGEETITVESVETSFSTFIMEHLQSVRSIMMMVFFLVIFWATF